MIVCVSIYLICVYWHVYIYITCIICVIRCVCDLHHIMKWFLCASPSCWYYFACMTIFKVGVIKHSENVGFPLAPLLSAFSQTVELEDAPRASHPTASDLTGHRTWIGVWCCQKHSFRNYSVTASLRAHCVPSFLRGLPLVIRSTAPSFPWPCSRYQSIVRR